MRWLVVALTLGCSPPGPPEELPPPAPVITAPPSSREAPLRARQASLEVEAEAGATVRLFPSGDCSGPELVRRPASAARSGLTVDLVHGENVFSAQAVSPAGLQSACSRAVTLMVRFRLRGEFPAPVVAQVLPQNPSTERQVRLRGISSAGWTVTVWSLPNCQGDVLSMGSAALFDREGLPLELPFNATLVVSLDAERGEDLSRCSEAVRLVHDGDVPDVGGAFLFPRPPHPWSFGTIVVPARRPTDRLEVFEGRECRGRSLLPFLQVQQSCALPTMCTAFVFPVALEATPVVSLRAVNPNGTTSRCVALEHTPSLDPPTPYVAMRFGFDSALVRAGTDVFPPALSPVESCERFESPALVLQVRSEPRSAPLMYFFRHVDGPLWLQRQGIASGFSCEPFPP